LLQADQLKSLRLSITLQSLAVVVVLWLTLAVVVQAVI
jgi:hypothetical protein